MTEDNTKPFRFKVQRYDPEKTAATHWQEFTVPSYRGMTVLEGLIYIKENLDRILPATLDAEINLNQYRLLPIYRYLKEKTGIMDEEMLRTFNMGVGIALVCSEKKADKIIDHMNTNRITCYAIGRIMEGNRNVTFKNSLSW